MVTSPLSTSSSVAHQGNHIPEAPPSPQSLALTERILGYLKKGQPIVYETKDLYIRQVDEGDQQYFRELMTDPAVTEKIEDSHARFVAEGETVWKEKQIKAADARHAELVKRWVVDKDPFSGFMMFRKTKEREFVGHAVAGHSRRPGVTEIAYYIPKQYWHQGYGTKAAEFILQYLTNLIAAHYIYKGVHIQIDGDSLVEAVAISRADNTYSIRIIEHIGMKKHPEQVIKWDAPQAVYRLYYRDPPKPLI